MSNTTPRPWARMTKQCGELGFYAVLPVKP